MTKHTIKRLLAIASLLTVGGMTAIAAGLPTPNAQAAEDSASTTVTVTVKERSFWMEPGGSAENGDPIIDAHFNDSVCRIEYQATDIASGTAIFVPPISQTIGTPRPEGNVIKQTLPFVDHGVANGDYNITGTAYSCSQPETVVGTNVLKLTYNNNPDVPHTDSPNTGFVMFGVDLARGEFIAIGGIILATAIACIILAVRKKHNKR